MLSWKGQGKESLREEDADQKLVSINYIFKQLILKAHNKEFQKKKHRNGSFKNTKAF